MKTIWKFPILISSRVNISIPKNAELLSVQTQRNIPCIWALVDPTEPLETREFEIFGTGHPIKCDNIYISRNFIGTFQVNEDSLVFHLFERHIK